MTIADSSSVAKSNIFEPIRIKSPNAQA